MFASALQNWNEIEEFNRELRWTLLEESDRNEPGEVIDLLGALQSTPRKAPRRAISTQGSIRTSTLSGNIDP